MNIPVIGFFNNKGGVGKTSLVYHLASMYREMGYRVLAADFDPQANLTAAFIDEEGLEEIWPDEGIAKTIYGALLPLIEGTGDIAPAHVHIAEDGPALIPGDLSLSRFEDQLSEVWPKCLDGDKRAFRVMSAFWRVMQAAAKEQQADVILMDLGPNLGAINRSALIAADYVVIPLAADLFSLQGLKNLGPTLRAWRKQWQERVAKNESKDFELPSGTIKPVGYIVLQGSERLSRPVRAYNRWIARIPEIYSEHVLGLEHDSEKRQAEDDADRLAVIRHYRSLMPMAQEAQKPIFFLKPADGAIGAHVKAVQNCYSDYKNLAEQIASKTAGFAGL